VSPKNTDKAIGRTLVRDPEGNRRVCSCRGDNDEKSRRCSHHQTAIESIDPIPVSRAACPCHPRAIEGDLDGISTPSSNDESRNLSHWKKGDQRHRNERQHSGERRLRRVLERGERVMRKKKISDPADS
jgi:hypothetical protein